MSTFACFLKERKNHNFSHGSAGKYPLKAYFLAYKGVGQVQR